jgi:hypothetical protein
VGNKVAGKFDDLVGMAHSISQTGYRNPQYLEKQNSLLQTTKWKVVTAVPFKSYLVASCCHVLFFQGLRRKAQVYEPRFSPLCSIWHEH